MDICETEGVIMKIKDYYKLSSTAAVVLQKYSETWSDWIDIKVEDICDKDKMKTLKKFLYELNLRHNSWNKN